MKADRIQVTRMLKTARGQLDGILKMVEEDRYCVDISHQLMAAEAVIRKINLEVLTAHLKSCVANAETDAARAEKVDEVVELMSRILK